MKKLIVVLAVVLSGCAIVFPKPHDPVMFDQIVYIQTDLNKATCADPKNWDTLLDRVHHLKVYTNFRNDPQSPAIEREPEEVSKEVSP